MDLEKLTPEEQAKLVELLSKAGAIEEDPPQDDPPEGERTWGEAPEPNPGPITILRLKEPKAWVEKQIHNITQVGLTNLLKGILTPKRSPRDAAISDAAQERYESMMRDPAVLERRRTNRAKVSDDEWVAITEKRAREAYLGGVRDRQYKIERFVEKYSRALAEDLREIDAMPVTTLEERIAKSAAMIRKLAARRGTFK